MVNYTILLSILTITAAPLLAAAEQENKGQAGLKKLEEIADKGDIDAQIIKGFVYYTGNEKTKRNPDKALEIFKKLAEKNMPEAQYMTGVVYLDKKEYENAYRYLEAAIINGSNDAEYLYGIILYKGMGTEKNEAEAFKYIKSAAENGNIQAKKFLEKNKQGEENVTGI